MDILSKLIIPQKSISDPDWEDTTVSGWLSFFVIVNIFGILFSLGSIYQMVGFPATFRWLLASFYLLPIYALIGIMMRFKDAVFITVSAIILAFISNAFIAILYISFAPTSNYGLMYIGWCVADLVWLIYFMKSKQVKRRWPRDERKVYAGDIIFVCLESLLIVLFCGSLLVLS